tara:strand:+ start:485 stop:1132 length:648 start_codon:yes stop_codon:yes gene_type:complete
MKKDTKNTKNEKNEKNKTEQPDNIIKSTSLRKKFNKLMIIAHPDDELIFGGAELMKNKGYKVVCITNQNDPIRLKEFVGLMKELKVAYEILNHPDNMNYKNVKKPYYDYIENLILQSNVTKITTHNKKGEYGHNFHKAVSNMVTRICKTHNNNENKLNSKLYYFHTGNISDKLDEKIIKKKLKLMEKYYPSQFKVLSSLKLDKSIEHQTLKKYEK